MPMGLTRQILLFPRSHFPRPSICNGLPMKLARPRSRLVSLTASASMDLQFRPPSGNMKHVDEKVRVLKQKMEVLGIKCDDSCLPGFYAHLLCPKCKGGMRLVTTLSLHIIQKADFAMWRCYHTSCGWAGQAFADNRETVEGMNKIFTVESLKEKKAERTTQTTLEPLGEEVLAYFSERMISEETLWRNGVLQMSGVGAKNAIIAFTYKQDGRRVGCKYRTIEKRFWQERGTEKWFYGLDDCTEATEVIIVEGEMDKLSLEEAGFRNCLSVPSGAPGTVSSDMPPLEKDRAFQYVWNCKEYLDKFSRILLAADSDTSGQALAKELSRRLSQERCWLVHWPMKNDVDRFKDANEVLMCLGPAALREAIEDAKPFVETY